MIRKSSATEICTFRTFSVFCLEDYAHKKTENSKQNVRMHNMATFNKRLCELSYNKAQACRTLRLTFYIRKVIKIRNWILKTKAARSTGENERTKERMSNLSFQFGWSESEEDLSDHKNSALIALMRWRSRTEPLLRILFVVFVLAILPRWLRITRNALAEHLTNPIEGGEDSRSLSFSIQGDKNNRMKW